MPSAMFAPKRRWAEVSALLSLGSLLAACGAASPDASIPPTSTVAEVALVPAPSAAPEPVSTSAPAPVASSPPPSPTTAPVATPSGTGSFFEVVPGPGQHASASPVSPSSVPPSSGPPKTLDASSAAEAIAAIRPGFQQCLRDQLEVTPGMTGAMSLDVDIQGDGSVGHVQRITAKNVPKPVIDCVVAIVKATRFPLPPGGKVTSLNIPIAFTR